MSKPNSDLSYQALDALKGNWGEAIAVTLIYGFISGCAGLLGTLFPILPFVSILIVAPLVVGLSIFYLSIIRGEKPMIDQLFEGFQFYLLTLGAYILMGIFTFLWTLLLIIPGIIKALSYSMTPFIIADDPNTTAMDAIDKSMVMMNGYKWKLFVLYLWFFVVSIGCLITLGIGYLWAIPYMRATVAAFYEDIKYNADEMVYES